MLGNIQTLILRNNKIVSVGALKKLYSLERLDLSDNLIASFHEVQELGSLPLLEGLWLQGNPISYAPDYRVQTLAQYRYRGVGIEFGFE